MRILIINLPSFAGSMLGKTDPQISVFGMRHLGWIWCAFTSAPSLIEQIHCKNTTCTLAARYRFLIVPVSMDAFCNRKVIALDKLDVVLCRLRPCLIELTAHFERCKEEYMITAC